MLTAFYHVALMGKGEEIANEVIKQIKNSGLLDNLTKLYVSVVGEGTLSLDIIKNIDVIYHNCKVTEYEYPTLQLIEDYVFCNYCYIWYLTGLGTTGRTIERENKRNYINYFLINKWRSCVYYLYKGYDVVGVDWRNDPLPHYTGFQWVADSKYLRTLPKIKDLNTEKYPSILTPRHNAEFWIGMKNPKYKSLWQSFDTDSRGKYTFHFEDNDWKHHFKKIKEEYEQQRLNS